ncbi:MAG: hypothetical protein QXE31_02120 [Candidatus Woesearchaeota archaeon]
MKQNKLKEKYRKLLIENRFKNIKRNIINLKENKRFFSFIFFLVFLLGSLSYIIFYFNYGYKGITGFQILGTRLIILTKVGNFCNLTLEKGWNLISFNCLGDDMSLNLFFGENKSFETLIAYDPNDLNDPWKSYNPNLPNWTVQDLRFISRREGYWLYVENKTQLEINGSLATPTLIRLVPGWNLIGFPSLNNKAFNETFERLIPNFDYVYMYNASEGLEKWKEYTWNTSLPSKNNFNYTYVNYGYWIFMINSQEFIIN